MKVNGQTSDGYHTFDELYDHRITLFIALARMMKTLGYTFTEAYDSVWRSKEHHPEDKPMYEGWFVMGISVDDGQQITYHLPLSRWQETDFAMTLDHAPKWDGHTPSDVIQRLKSL